MQAIPARHPVFLEHAPAGLAALARADGALGQGIPTAAPLFQPDVVRLQGRAADRADHRADDRVQLPCGLFQIAPEHLEIPVVARRRAEILRQMSAV